MRKLREGKMTEIEPGWEDRDQEGFVGPGLTSEDTWNRGSTACGESFQLHLFALSFTGWGYVQSSAYPKITNVRVQNETLASTEFPVCLICFSSPPFSA